MSVYSTLTLTLSIMSVCLTNITIMINWLYYMYNILYIMTRKHKSHVSPDGCELPDGDGGSHAG